MGGVWERQIRTVRSILSSLMLQHASRLDSASLRTFFYEAIAIVNSHPLTTDNLNVPDGPEPLTPNHLITMKSSVILPPPGNFERKICIQESDGKEFSPWQTSSGIGLKGNIFKHNNKDRNGTKHTEM